MHFFTASIAHVNGEITNRRIVADDYKAARKAASRIAAGLEDVTSVEVWQ